jgi:hypothetical protein
MPKPRHRDGGRVGRNLPVPSRMLIVNLHAMVRRNLATGTSR